MSRVYLQIDDLIEGFKELRKKAALICVDDLIKVIEKRTGDKYIRIGGSQYIGLNDMNGKQIYTHDIVRYKNRIYEVRYEPCSFILYSEKAKVFPDVFDGPFIEVIGNVFDNPELLEVE